MSLGFKLFLFGLVVFASFWVYQFRRSDLMTIVDQVQDPRLRPAPPAAPSRASPVHPVRELLTLSWQGRAAKVHREGFHHLVGLAGGAADDVPTPGGGDEALAEPGPGARRVGEPGTAERLAGKNADGEAEAGADGDAELVAEEIAEPGPPGAEPHALAAPAREGEGATAGAPASADEPEMVDFVEIEHLVKNDERLWTIARRYFGRGMDYEKIARWNGLREKNPVIVPGMRLKIRVPRQELRKRQEQQARDEARKRDEKPARAKARTLVHQVQRGDTLVTLARRYYRAAASSESWRKIYRANRSVLKDPNRLVIGMKLTIPDVGPSAPEGR